jgi:class 3 adenylate cyclase
MNASWRGDQRPLREMIEGRVERRLAAILAVDVAGYSRLMGEDEEGTLAALRAVRREPVDPKIAEHRGRIVKTTGDGLLVEFASVVDAVRCAVELQREMIARNAAARTEQRIEFRMGINVGDIIIEDGDIFGDGVNIAARLEALAEPGGFASVPRRTSRCATASTSPSMISANNRSRTSQDPCTSMVSLSAQSPARRYQAELRCRSLTSHRSRCCRFRI